MANLSYIILFAALALVAAQGSEEQAGTCGTNDETCLLQTHVIHNKRPMEMNPVLAELEKAFSAIPEGRHVLNQLLHGVMALPALKTERDMRAAVLAHPRLQHLGRLYPQLAPAMAMLENPQTIKALQNHVGRKQGRQPRVVTPAKRVPYHAGFLEMKKAHEIGETLLLWTEGWGCDINISYTDYPSGSFLVEHAIFGTEPCYGWPWIQNVWVDVEAYGAYFFYGNYSQETSEYSHSIGWVDEEGTKDLGSLGSQSTCCTFQREAKQFMCVQANHDWTAFGLKKVVSESGGLQISELSSDVAVLDCSQPDTYYGGITSVPGTTDVILKCMSDWNLPDDKHKIVKVSDEGVWSTVLAESDDWINWVHVTKSYVFYSIYHWDSTTMMGGSKVYKVGLEGGDPENIGDLSSSAWQFVVDEATMSMVYGAWDFWDSSTSQSWYNVTALDEHGVSKTFLRTNGFENAQFAVYDPLGGTDEETPGDVEVSGTWNITKDGISVKVHS